MKGTRHNGRSGKDGVYNPLHNDRRFDPEHSEHIDNERVRQNIYWDCYQGYTTMADRGKEDNFSFNQIEMAYYVDHYSDYVINQNKRHEKARHPDRCKGVEDVLKNKKTCPEESIYQLGTIDEHASVETLVLVFDEFKKEFDERFGSNVHIIDWSLHMDEATPHIHERHVFDATNRYGEIEPKQEAALEELGFELPNPEKKRSKTNNRKVVFDSACRTMFLDICKRHGLEIDEEPSYGGSTVLKADEETGRNAIYMGTAGSSFGRKLVCASRRAQQFKKSRTGSTSESIGGTLLAGTAESKRIKRDSFFEKGGFWKPETPRICRNERTAAGGTGFYGGEDGTASRPLSGSGNF